MKWIIGTRRGRWACGLVGVALAACALAIAYQRPAAAADDKVEEMRELASVFGSKTVTIYVDAECAEPGKGWVKDARVVGTVDVLGKKFLKAKTGSGTVLLDMDRVAVFTVKH